MLDPPHCHHGDNPLAKARPSKARSDIGRTWRKGDCSCVLKIRCETLASGCSDYCDPKGTSA